MSKFEELREKYPIFIYKGYNINCEETVCKIEYLFEIPGLTEFHPTWEFPIKKEFDKDEVKKEIKE